MKKEILSFDVNNDLEEEFHFIENEKKCSKKKILIPLIAISIIIALVSTVFIVGITKFGWFMSNDKYDIDIKVKSYVNQAEYFTERKTVKSQLVYSTEDKEEKEQIIDTKFLVVKTDRNRVFINSKKVKIDYLNNATLIILDSKARIDNEETKLDSFNIFDEKVLREFESNPNGKYPMAQFSFYDNGTVLEINLPKNMDKYYAQAILELIDNVIPKLSRNSELDKKNGLTVESIKTKEGETLTETHSSREYFDKYTGTKYEGSKFSKKVERNFKNDRLINIRSNQKLILETQRQENQIDFGLKNFTYDISSEILSIKNEEEKQETELVKKLTKQSVFIRSDKLMENILEQEKEELKKKNEENEENEDNEENKEETDLDEQSEDVKRLRRLGWDGSFSYSWEISSTDILGKKVSLTYSISLSSGKVKNTLTVKCGSFSYPFGNKDGTSSNQDKPKTTGLEKTVFSIPFPGLTVPITFDFKVKGSIGYKVNYNTSNKQFSITLTGSVEAIAEVIAGIKEIINLKGGIRGTFISVSLGNTLTKSGSAYTCSNSLSATTGTLVAYVSGEVLKKEVFKKEYTIYVGKSLK